MILAGSHSLGTGAACSAATSPALISEIHDWLRKDVGTEALSKREKTIWVLVKGTVGEQNRDGTPKVEIIGVGACDLK